MTEPHLSLYTAALALAIASAGVAAVLAYIAVLEDRLRGLRTLSASYALSTLRFGTLLTAPAAGAASLTLADMLHAGAAALMAIAAARVAGVPERRTAIGAAAALVAAWSASPASAALGRIAAQAPLALFAGAAQLYLAWALWRLGARAEYAGFRTVAAISSLHGLHKLDIPFWPTEPAWQFWGQLLGGTLYLATGIGLLVAAQRAQTLVARAAREQFARLIELSPAPIIISKLPEGRLLLVNEAWCALTGYRRDEVVGRVSSDLGLWPMAEQRAALLERLKKGERVRDMPRQMRCKDGRVVDLLYSAEPIAWQDQDAFIGISIDVTELERARADAHAARARVEAILTHAPVAIAITTREEGRFRFVNPAWSRMYGYSAEEVADLRAADIGFWTGAAQRRAALAPLLERGEPLQIEHRFVARGGRALEILMACTPIEFDGEACIVSIVQDITALAEARRAAHEQAARFAKTFAVSPVPLAIAAAESGRHIEVNPAWERFFGWSREDAVGRSALEMGIWVDPQEHARFVAALRAGGALRGEPCRLKRRSGEAAELLFSADLIDWRGEPALLIALQDVTELRRAHHQLRALYEQVEEKVRARTAELEKALREIEAFSYTVSHDLRAPLRHIAGFAGLLLERPAVRADAEAAGYAERLGAAARRLGTMVDSLLEYSRLGRRQLALAQVDLGAEARQIAAELDGQAAGRRVLWTIGPLPVVRGDPTLLRLLLQNLLDNALKYTRPRPEARIEIGARREGSDWVVHVRDNGVGFDMRYTAKLFGVFQRLHRDSEFEGTGIGLAHAARIVERHGGRIWCDAMPERGATFYFTLPA
ncbi:MAG: PAS domain S-box protein [Pseudomonadota bacterium]